MIELPDVIRTVGLWQVDPVEPRADDRLQVQLRMRRAQPVDPDVDQAALGRKVADRLGDHLARLALLRLGHRVLKVEIEDVGRNRARALNEARAHPWDRQHAADDSCSRCSTPSKAGAEESVV